MIRVMENIDLAQCGMIYSKAFPMEHFFVNIVPLLFFLQPYNLVMKVSYFFPHKFKFVYSTITHLLGDRK